ncbi:helix-turn-helix transcriptional regulator [Holdemanella sp. SCCA2]|nr:helix-turn-helix transcriptional regulator [Holdemanella sp. SCCA2]HBJ06250.1 XRE family transcriptional regulator [Erysipelotrichaceae bacterium]
MISYQPFYETLYKKNVTEYALIYKFGLPANTIHRMKHNKPITTTTLDTLCEILQCRVEDILEYIPPEDI